MDGINLGVRAFLMFSAVLGLFHRDYLRSTPANVAYLKQHVVAQGRVDGDVQWNFPLDLSAKKLILLAEAHGSLAPQSLDLSLLKSLNIQTGLRYYVAEIDPTEADVFNNFLETGDERGMREVFDLWTPKEQWGNRDFEAKIRAIRTYNQTLLPDRRIVFLGLDEVQYFPYAIKWIARTTGVTVDNAWLQSFAKQPRKQLANAIISWNAGRKATNSKDQAALEAVLFTLARNAEGVPNRDTVIFDDYRYQVEHGVLGNQQAYGMWGMFHGLQASARRMLPFAAQVRRSNLSAANSIATILSIGVNSEMMIPASELPSFMRPSNALYANLPSGAHGPLIYAKGITDFERAAPLPNQITVFWLDAPYSPYETSLSFGPHWTELEAMPFDKPLSTTTGYVQYVAFYRGSRAVQQRSPGE
jgi:hypothetical protein